MAMELEVKVEKLQVSMAMEEEVKVRSFNFHGYGGGGGGGGKGEDDLITGSDALEDVEHVKALFHKQVDMKDLGELRYFLGIEIIHNEGGIWPSQKKYGLDMLMKYGMANCKLIFTPLDQNLKLRINEGEVLEDATMYRKIVDILIYMIISEPNLNYTVGLVN
ncbi:hypothetical protein L7F22_055432 [Adiantum nelumboides]|nr:hypothetical protein [Adiantum nelumboides]